MRPVYSQRAPAIDRFWSRVEKGDSCWNWQGCGDGDGYGSLSVDGRQVRVHRYSWVLHNSTVPGGLCVCHHCDNRKCVRPDHLFLGTKKDNTRDMVSKGRCRKPTETHCGQGHEWNDANTRIQATRRCCRACERMWARQHREAKRGAA